MWAQNSDTNLRKVPCLGIGITFFMTIEKKICQAKKNQKSWFCEKWCNILISTLKQGYRRRCELVMIDFNVLSVTFLCCVNNFKKFLLNYDELL